MIARSHNLSLETKQGMPENLFGSQLSPRHHDDENTAIAVLICLPVLAPTPKLVISAVLFSAWMAMLLFGWIFGGAIHLLLLASVALFPWKVLKS